jgi:hypothetical protein
MHHDLADVFMKALTSSEHAVYPSLQSKTA